MTRSSYVLGWLYIACLFVFSLLIHLKIIQAQTGILVFFSVLFLLCILYSGLIGWNEERINQHFLTLLLLGIFSKLLLSFSTPLWEDDWARYLWEGNLILRGLSPYLHAPASFFHSHPNFPINDREIEILSRINHPDWTTIYFPLVVLYFTWIAKIAPLSLAILKLSYVLWDILTCCLLTKIRNKKAGLLYFLFPILIKETYLNAHFEILCIFLITLSIRLIQIKKYNLAILVLGLAIHSKIFLIVICPLYFTAFLVRDSKSSFPKCKPIFAFFSLFLLGFYFPFLVLDVILPANGSMEVSNLFLFANNFEFNSTFYFLFKSISSHSTALFFSYLLLCSFLFYSLIHWKHILVPMRRGIAWMFLCFLLYLLVTPIANPWYFLILVPLYFASQSPKNSLWLVLVVPQISYFTGTNLHLDPKNFPVSGFYDIPNFIIITEIILVFALITLNFRKYSILLYISSNISNLCKRA